MADHFNNNPIVDQSTDTTITAPGESCNQILTRSKLKKLKQQLLAQQALQQCTEIMKCIVIENKRLVSYKSMMPHCHGNTPTECHLRLKIEIYEKVLCKFVHYLNRITNAMTENPSPLHAAATIDLYNELTQYFLSNQ